MSFDFDWQSVKTVTYLARFLYLLCLGSGFVAVALSLNRIGLRDGEGETLADWKKRVDARFGLAGIVFGGLVFAVLFFGLQSAHAYRDRQMPPHLFLTTPYLAVSDPLVWAFPAGLVAVFAGVVGREWLMRRVLGPTRMTIYRTATELAGGTRVGRLGGVVAAFAVPLTLVGVVLALDWYCRVETDRIVVNRLWSIGESSYPYSDVALLVETSHWEPIRGTVWEGDGFHVVFRDGTYWSFAGRADVHRPLVDHLERATGRRVISAYLLEQLLPGRRQLGRR